MSTRIEKLQEAVEAERLYERTLFESNFKNLSLEHRISKGTTIYPVQYESFELETGDKLLITINLPETFKRGFFQEGCSVSIFGNDGKKYPRISGVLTNFTKNQAKIMLSCSEIPEWIEEFKLGMDWFYDEHTYEVMLQALNQIQSTKNSRETAELCRVLLGEAEPEFNEIHNKLILNNLNKSQIDAVSKMLGSKHIGVIQGPPGTGKTTTVCALVYELVQVEKRVLVCAPSNLATDLLATKLSKMGLRVLRVGHPGRISAHARELSVEAKISQHTHFQEIKKLRRRANEAIRAAKRWIRTITQEHIELKKQAKQDAKDLRKEAQNLEKFIEQDILTQSQVIVCTCTGAANEWLKEQYFQTVVIDEAGQALEPACWIPILKAKRIILAGDPCQLPPTVKNPALAPILSKTLLETLMAKYPQIVALLDQQYRMHETIMEFSNQKFYQSKLIADASVATKKWNVPAENILVTKPVLFLDTAGCGFEEMLHPESQSYYNPEEAQILLRFLDIFLKQLKTNSPQEADSLTIGIISPYKEQTYYLESLINDFQSIIAFKHRITIDTVDGFQGQERSIIAISLVRSNQEKNIGFLADKRRFNVAITRAKMTLIVAGDSSTIGNDSFYQDFVTYAETVGGYESAWSFIQ